MANANFNLLGTVITVKSFAAVEGIPAQFSQQPGQYFVESLVAHHDGKIELGLAEFQCGEHIEYFELDKIEIDRLDSNDAFVI